MAKKKYPKIGWKKKIARLEEKWMAALMNNERNKAKLAKLYAEVSAFQARLMDIMTGEDEKRKAREAKKKKKG